MKNYALILTVLSVSSFGALAEQHERDDNIRRYHDENYVHSGSNNKLDNQKYSILNDDKLRLKSFEDHSVNIKIMGQTGGYDFSHLSRVNNINSHYRNHR